jgi:uncharacterized protein (TIGR00369 family)
MSVLRIEPLNDLVYRVLNAQGEHVGNLKHIGAVWKFKAIGYDAQGEVIPGGGPLTLQHNQTFSQADVVEINARLNAATPGADLQIPEGFREIEIGGPFIAHNGPLYGKWDGKRLYMGFRVEERHTNPLQICHGGMLATFADMLIPCASMYQCVMERHFLPTISLQVDYMGASKLGAWVQGEADVLKTTRNMIFGQALVSADGQPVMRVSGIFKIGPLIGNGIDPDPLGLK